MAAITEFEDVNSANNAKVSLSNFKFDPNSSTLTIDFAREDSTVTNIPQQQVTIPNVQMSNLAVPGL